MNRYFFDTYAIFEIINGNKNYISYAEQDGVTTIFNIVELSYGLKRKKSKEEANNIISLYKKRTIKLKWEDITNATDLKLKYKKLSISDAIGYTVAKRLNIPFLTGDEDFKNFDNVEFIKK